MHYNIADLIESVADAVPDRVALVCGERRLSYAALDERASRLAHFLASQGVGPGDQIGLYLQNGTEYMEAMLAAFKLRAVPANINFRYMAEELRYLCRDAKLKVNGKAISAAQVVKKGYAHIKRAWQNGDVVELTLPMPVERIEAHPSVGADRGLVALQRGPVVYCLEEVDNDPVLNDIVLPSRAKFTVKTLRGRLGKMVVVGAKAWRSANAGWENELYRAERPARRESTEIRAMPYSLWDNRKPGEMIVWMRSE